MKSFITILSLLIASNAMPQDNNQLNTLINKKKKLESEIVNKQDSLRLLNLKIDQLTNQIALQSIKNQPQGMVYKTVIINSGKIRKENNPNSDVVEMVTIGDTVYLTDFIDNYWIVNRGKYFGYISELYLKVDDGLENFKKTVLTRREILAEKAAKNKKEQEYLEYKKARETRANNLVKKYGKETGEKLAAGYYWIGMTKQMALDSLGNPENINSSVGSWGVSEQWVYDNMYLYFDNGILTSYQTSR